MAFIDLKEIKEKHFDDNPCRGIVAGMGTEGQFIELSWIMGRSPNSQNRIYVIEDEILRTEAADPKKVENPELIIYNTMRNNLSTHVVSNGAQTDTIINQSKEEPFMPTGFVIGCGLHYCEPDAPTFTPRISAKINSSRNELYFSILKANQHYREIWTNELVRSGLKPENFDNGKRTKSQMMEALRLEISQRCNINHREFPTDYQYFVMPALEGIGYCLTTYKPGSKTLDPFEGEPIAIPLVGSLEKIMETYWNMLEPEWRVALGGKEIEANPLGIGYRFARPINKYEKIE